MPKPIFKSLPISLREEIEESVKKIGSFATANKYAKQAGMSEWGLYHNLSKKVKTGEIVVPGRVVQPNNIKPVKKAQKLTDEEKLFLQDLKSGKKDISEISRMVAVKVFEKMLKYPDDFKFYDFYQAQLLQLKQEEAKSKNTIAMELINRLFAGKLPPTHCPKCGTEIIKLETVAAIEEGEVVKDD